MINRFEIIGHESSRPDAERILFCDGTGGGLYRAETDLELSHWRPNTTPGEYRAGTSTEICYRFLDDPRPGSWTAAVNNHVDVDGILSVFVLVKSEFALANRTTIVGAAEMGDFWGWGEPAAQRVFHGITLIMNRQAGSDARAMYVEAFHRIPAFVDGTDSHCSHIEQSLAPLRQAVELVEQGKIVRSLIDDRLAHYVLPQAIAGDDDSRASYAPGFNEAISTKAVLWPHARAKWDSERACIISSQRKSGWFHDLCFPGYHWADTTGRWLVPGLTYHDGMSSYELKNESLIAAWNELQRLETAPGRWGLGGTALPFGEDLQQQFPLVGRFSDEHGRSAVSGLTPDRVARTLEGVFVRPLN